ncbi:MAG: M50 family metallopeptidase, partial [Oscillospiraceae bacterium]
LPGSFSSKPLWPRLKVILAGSFFNIIMGYLILVALTAINGYVGTTVVASFNEGAVSSQTLRLEDRIMRVNGKRVTTSNDIVYELLRDQDGLVDLTIQRDGEKQIVPVQFELETVEEGVQFINLDFKMWAHSAAPLDYLTYPVNWGLSIVKQVWGSLIDLITGRYAVNQLSGPVGVVSAIGAASKMGLESVMLMAAFIAINVGIFNLLPLPILDGGKVLIMLIEAVIRRPINAKLIDWTMTGSVVLMMMLMLYVTYNDIFKLIVK